MIAEKIAEESALYISSQNKMPKCIRISKTDLDTLAKERPEVITEGHIWGLRIELASEALTGYLTVGE